MATIKVDNSNFQSTVLDSDVPVVVDFWAEWCGPCKAIGPALEEISDEMGDKIKITKVNSDENPEIAAKYGVRSIPTLILFKNGEPAALQVGAKPKNGLVTWINGAI
ncbi:MAG: thioredoxin [Hyphomicrobiales bacterium]|nr:MAG: thioredoxin [Hyphomicrobiales bacterium]